MQLLCLTIFAAVTAAQTCKDWNLPWGTYNGSLNDNNVRDSSKSAYKPLTTYRYASIQTSDLQRRRWATYVLPLQAILQLAIPKFLVQIPAATKRKK